MSSTFLSVLSEADVNGDVQDTENRKYPHLDYIAARLTLLYLTVINLFNTAGTMLQTKTSSANLISLSHVTKRLTVRKCTLHSTPNNYKLLS